VRLLGRERMSTISFKFYQHDTREKPHACTTTVDAVIIVLVYYGKAACIL
jgi:hypothetical protein